MSGAPVEIRRTSPETPVNAYGDLMLQTARVVRMRYVRCTRDPRLSPAEADELADLFERLARGDSGVDQIDPNEAIGLAFRILDDDNPEFSSLWPRRP